MKKILLPSFFLLTFIASAQLNNRFYSNGNPGRIASVGAYGANTYLQWREVQQTPTSSYNWSFSDALVQAYHAAGLHLMITLSCAHPVNSDDTTPGTCAYLFSNGSGDNNANWPVTGADTTQWKQFVNAIVDRYDKDGNNDMPGLINPVTLWHIIGQEWSRVWCDVPYTDNSLQYAKDFVRIVNLTYNVIKTKQPQSTVSYAGIDVRFQGDAFYDGYLPAGQTTICNNINNCTSQANSTQTQLAAAPKFLPSRENVMYIFKNALTDEVDLHQYGRWENTSDFVRWAKDSTFNKPIIFMEGGGPFCPACENIYHSATDNDGILPPPLVRDNASYVIYYYISGLASDVKKLHWNLPNEYAVWGATWGDLDLHSKNDIRKPSFYIYRFLAQTIFSKSDADTVVKVTELNPALYHYQINPMALNVAWSTNTTDSIIVNGTGTLERWDIPTTCDSIYPTYCDSLVQQSSVNVSGSYTIHLNDEVPVFYSWNDVLTGINSSAITKNISVKVYPNPFSNSTTLEITNGVTANYKLMIYDLFGRTVYQSQIINHKSEIYLDLPDGMYFYQVLNKRQVIGNGKIVIQ